jgi:hypothetical protein
MNREKRVIYVVLGAVFVVVISILWFQAQRHWIRKLAETEEIYRILESHEARIWDLEHVQGPSRSQWLREHDRESTATTPQRRVRGR